MRQLLIVLGLTIAVSASAQEVERSIDPGMSKAQVIERLGPPAAVRSFDSTTYLLYANGCERSCGMQDLVVLDNDSVVDAVFRSPLRHYTGTSSSPEEKAPVLVHRTSARPLTVKRAAARPVVPSVRARAETASVTSASVAPAKPAASTAPEAKPAASTTSAPKPAASAAPAPKAAAPIAATTTAVAANPATVKSATPKPATPSKPAAGKSATSHAAATPTGATSSPNGSPLAEIGKVSAPPVGAVAAPMPKKKRYSTRKHSSPSRTDSAAKTTASAHAGSTP